MALKHSPASSKQAYSIRIDGSNRPIALIGRVQVTVTSGRGMPPAPHCGFITNLTPFDRGHIMALELGGPDIAENIVPQYRHWQETGTWRNIETRLCWEKNANNAIFAVRLSYPSHADTYVDQQKRFSENKIFDWKDARIPDDFTIWFLPAGDDLAKKIEKDLLTVAAVEKNFTDLFADIDKQKPYVTLAHNAMPLEDRTYWENQQIAIATKAAYETYSKVRKSDIAEMETELTSNPIPGLSKQEKREAIDVTRSPMRDDVEFVTTQKPLIAKELETTWGWPPSQTAALNGGRVTHAYLGKPNASQQKVRKKKHEEYVKKADASKLKMQGYAAVKRVPYQGKGHTANKQY